MLGFMDIARGRQGVQSGSTVSAGGELKENILERGVNILSGHSLHFCVDLFSKQPF